MPDLTENVSREILEVVPLIMGVIRAEMRSRRSNDISVPQFRILTFLKRHPGASLSDVADHAGLTPPSVSAMIDGLVERKLVTRETSTADRRRIHLSLTLEGMSSLEAALHGTQERLAESLSTLAAPDQETILQAMETLRSVFALRPAAYAIEGR